MIVLKFRLNLNSERVQSNLFSIWKTCGQSKEKIHHAHRFHKLFQRNEAVQGEILSNPFYLGYSRDFLLCVRILRKELLNLPCRNLLFVKTLLKKIITPSRRRKSSSIDILDVSNVSKIYFQFCFRKEKRKKEKKQKKGEKQTIDRFEQSLYGTVEPPRIPKLLIRLNPPINGLNNSNVDDSIKSSRFSRKWVNFSTFFLTFL